LFLRGRLIYGVFHVDFITVHEFVRINITVGQGPIQVE
jgi:hypothetical protein